MKFIKNDKEKEKILLEMSHDDLLIILASLGELVAGVTIEDFEFYTRLGCTRKRMKKLAMETRNIIDENGIEL